MNSQMPTQPKRREAMPSSAAALKSQMAMADLPKLIRTFGKQQSEIHKELNAQTVVLKNQLSTSINERDWIERLHERIDALAIEGRVSNVLLAELVSIHKSIATDDVPRSSENIRADAYNRVLNGE